MSLQTIVNTGSSPDDAFAWSSKSNANFAYLAALIAENNNAVETNYADIAAMLADQTNQTSGKIQYVADASADTNITSGYAYYEYLGTTVGDLTDYRLLSPQETSEFISNSAFNEVKVVSVLETETTVVADTGVAVRYSSGNITELVFNQVFSKYLQAYLSLIATKDISIKLFNKTQQITLIANVETITNNTVSTNVYTKLTLEAGALVENIAEGDVLLVDLDFDTKSTNQLIQKFTVDAVQDDTTQLTSSGAGNIGVEYNDGTGNVSAFLFNQIYSAKLAVIAEYVDISNLQIQLYNYTTARFYTCKILSFDTVGSYKRANICESMVNDFVVNDVVDFQVVVSNGSGDTTNPTTTEVTDSTKTFTATEKGLDKIFKANASEAQVFTLNSDLYAVGDYGIIRRGENNPSLEIKTTAGNLPKGIRNIENRSFINDKNSSVYWYKDADGKIALEGNLTRGYTGAVSTTSYTALTEGGGAQDITVIGTGFSVNMLDPVLTGNATLNSWTYVNNNQITLNITPSGVATDLITVTYDNGDIFVDTDAIEIEGAAPSYDTADLRHYYPLDVNSNDAVAVNSINGIDTDITYSGGYAVFNGTTSKITLSDDDSFSYGDGSTDEPMSVTGTINGDVVAGGRIGCKWGNGIDQEFRIELSAGKLRLACKDFSLNFQKTYECDTVFSTGTDYHFCITKSAANDFNFYINGSLTTKTTIVNDASYVAMENLADDFVIGQLSYSASNAFDGKIRRLGLWDVVLDATQVSDVYETEVTNDNDLL